MEILTSLVEQYDPVLHLPIYFTIFNIVWTWIASEITGNCSQVDRLWSILPTVYSCYYALLPWMPSSPKDIQDSGLNQRVVLMAVLQVLWSVRLTYNTLRRGLYALKEEDYRWQILRDILPVPLYKVFNLVFIAAMQNGILYGLAYPTYTVLRQPNTPLGYIDVVLAVLALLDLLAEFTADNQQYSFQTYKHSKPRVLKPVEKEWLWARQRWTEADVKRGFVVRGLWAWSRHPNFAAEQTFWWLMVMFPIMTGPTALDLPDLTAMSSSATYTSLSSFVSAYSSLGPLVPGLVISALFLGSTTFTEYITKGKYPIAYGAYQRRVGMFSPAATVFKGLALKAMGEKEAVDAIVWGSKGSVKNGKVE